MIVCQYNGFIFNCTILCYLFALQIHVYSLGKTMKEASVYHINTDVVSSDDFFVDMWYHLILWRICMTLGKNEWYRQDNESRIFWERSVRHPNLINVEIWIRIPDDHSSWDWMSWQRFALWAQSSLWNVGIVLTWFLYLNHVEQNWVKLLTMWQVVQVTSQLTALLDRMCSEDNMSRPTLQYIIDVSCRIFSVIF